MNEATPEPIRSVQARKDLAEIEDRVSARKGDDAAREVILNILAHARRQARFPHTGRSRDELFPGLRSFFVKPHVVFFRPVRDTIELIHILHHKQDTERIVRETLGTSGEEEE